MSWIVGVGVAWISLGAVHVALLRKRERAAGAYLELHPLTWWINQTFYWWAGSFLLFLPALAVMPVAIALDAGELARYLLVIAATAATWWVAARRLDRVYAGIMAAFGVRRLR